MHPVRALAIAIDAAERYAMLLHEAGLREEEEKDIRSAIHSLDIVLSDTMTFINNMHEQNVLASVPSLPKEKMN